MIVNNIKMAVKVTASQDIDGYIVLYENAGLEIYGITYFWRSGEEGELEDENIASWIKLDMDKIIHGGLIGKTVWCIDGLAPKEISIGRINIESNNHKVNKTYTHANGWTKEIFETKELAKLAMIKMIEAM